jgi:hypothetical protein
MRRQCGVFDPANACRCDRIAVGAAASGLFSRESPLFAAGHVMIQVKSA